jgi:hypothetical protein
MKITEEQIQKIISEQEYYDGDFNDYITGFENGLRKQLMLGAVVGRSEQLPCPHCGQLEPCAGNSPETCYHPKVC